VDPIVDLRSDTVTKPTPEMRKAMAEAEVGDDVAGDDPSVNRLEEYAAEFIGKEAAVFVPSGTMGNLAAILSVTKPGDALICGAFTHSAEYEGGSPAGVGGVTTRSVPLDADGVLTPHHIEQAVPPPDVHYPKPTLVILENTNNRGGGTCTSLQQTQAVADTCRSRGFWLHIDGARICNSAVKQQVAPAELAGPGDSIMFCLSKGLCAPVGSLLAGSAELIKEARRKRKMLGGGMRQAGVLAAAGLVSLTKMVNRLAEDHEKARVLGVGLAGSRKLDVALATVQTNMVYFSLRSEKLSPKEFAEALGERGVRCYSTGDRIRLVTHHDVPSDHIPLAVERITASAEELL